ncbi:GNAT family N-acetyltransferase [Thermoactinospora rubra]|uniref:GNAT family N-acetyltransferase n=1 Tax=Thermoactinospora rubra TaxID=1088767 RepID=UPI001301A81E|nr:GNAT family N-acetyltransferase [Thermoactinospora rubra]
MRLTSAAEPELMHRVYGAAFAQPPWSETPEQIAAFPGKLAAHSAMPGFLCRLAWVDRELAGFTYGFRNPEWPDEPFYRNLREAAGDLSHLFELVEVAVDPRFSGRRIGTAMLGSLMEEAGPSWLLTSPRAVAAVRLYGKLGWRHHADVGDLRVYLSPCA